MAMQPTISVIISTYNNPQFLRLTLESYMNQTYRDFEIIVADDGSGTETKNLFDEFAEKKKLRIRHVWQEDQGYRLASVRNRGVEASSGKFLLFTDQDTLAPPDLLAKLSKITRPNVFIQGPTHYLNKRDTERVLRSGLDYQFIERKAKMKLAYRIYFKFLSHGLCQGRFMLVPREKVIAINGFNEEFKSIGAEDCEFCMRLIMNGIQMRVVDHYVYHLWHKKNGLKYVPNGCKVILARLLRTMPIICKSGVQK